MKYRYQFSVRNIAKKKGYDSERSLANKAGLSRTGLRPLLTNEQNVRVNSITQLATQLDRDIYILATNRDTQSDFSTIASAYKVLRDGFDSWKIHFMDFVDEFRRTSDPQLLLLEPPKKISIQMKALLASIVCHLCYEECIDPPIWASKNYFLDEPWFVSGMHSLKATALVESPQFYRKNNIFVLSNFLERV